MFGQSGHIEAVVAMLVQGGHLEAVAAISDQGSAHSPLPGKCQAQGADQGHSHSDDIDG